VSGFAAGLSQQELGRCASEQVAGLADRGERHRGRLGELDVVVADDGQVAGDVQAHPHHPLQQPERQQVVGAECGGRSPGRRQAGQSFARAAALGDVERRRLQ
jgi:hypothetical protein